MKKPGLPKKLLKLLDRLGGLGPEDLLKEFTEETVRDVRTMAEELDEKMVLERVISEKRFIEVVGDLAETNRIWSSRYDETVTLAGKAAEEGKTDQARWILDGFRRFCPSPHYRGLVERMIGEL